VSGICEVFVKKNNGFEYVQIDQIKLPNNIGYISPLLTLFNSELKSSVFLKNYITDNLSTNYNIYAPKNANI